jgi:hypothetical protein
MSLDRSRALWNRRELDLDSDEVLAQILDRGDTDDWRALYALARDRPELRARMYHVVRTVPLPTPHFWLAALSALGEPVDWDAPLPRYEDAAY